MKKITTKLTAFIFVMIATFGATAQDALWQLDFEKGVVWTKITDSGILLVGTGDRDLHGIDSRDGNILWSNDILKASNPINGEDGKKLDDAVAFDRFVYVLEDPEYPEMGDFIEIKFTTAGSPERSGLGALAGGGAGLGGIGSKAVNASGPAGTANYAIINIQNGEIVMSPEKAGMPVSKFMGRESATFNYKGTSYIPKLRMAIISASWIDVMSRDQATNNVTKMVQMPEGKVIWETTEIGIDSYPFVMNNGDVVLAGANKIARLDSKTGAIKWQFETSEKKQTFGSFDLSLDLSTGYFFEQKKNNGSLVAHDMATGKRLWEVEMKLKEVPALAAMGYGVVTIDSKEFTLYDLKGGQELWRKKKIDGTVIDLGEKGVLVTAKEKFLVLLNKQTGDVIWEEKIKGIKIDQIVAKGIMYADDRGRLGLIQYDGEKVWDKKGMLEVPSLRYRPEYTKELMYINGDLYEVDLLSGDYKVLVGKLGKAWKDEEVPASIELVSGGYLISSSNEMKMLETDGSVRWEKYWEAPGISLAAKIALRASQVVAFTMAVAATTEEARNRDRYGNETYESKKYAQQAEDWLAVSSMAGEEVKKKFRATVAKGNDVLVLTAVGAGGQNKSSGLVKVDKRTGEDQGSLLLGDKKPIYDYDAITSTIFFKADKKVVICYKI